MTAACCSNTHITKISHVNWIFCNVFSHHLTVLICSPWKYSVNLKTNTYKQIYLHYALLTSFIWQNGLKVADENKSISDLKARALWKQKLRTKLPFASSFKRWIAFYKQNNHFLELFNSIAFAFQFHSIR